MVHDYRALETARQDAAILIDSEAFWHMINMLRFVIILMKQVC